MLRGKKGKCLEVQVVAIEMVYVALSLCPNHCWVYDLYTILVQ